MRSFVVTSTVTLTDIPNWDTRTRFTNITVENNTNGDVELYLGTDAFVSITCKQDTYRAFDGFVTQGSAKIKNSTGTGGEVIIHVWREEERRS